MKDDRAPSLDLSGLSLSPSIWLRSGSPAAPGVICLRLLPSGPDRVHNTPLHRTQPSTLFAEERSNLTKPQHWEFSPAAADCGLQGTATSPPSTIITSLLTGFSKAPLEGQKPFYTTTGTPHPSEHMNGEGGIRTHGTLLAPTRSPGAPDRPLSHLSAYSTWSMNSPSSSLREDVREKQDIIRPSTPEHVPSEFGSDSAHTATVQKR